MGNNFDFVVVGGGILGLSLATKLSDRFPDCSIAILEKESKLGCHASGRNSGVLHSGIYYPETSLKAQHSSAGAAWLSDFCNQYKLPIRKVGKVILPLRPEDEKILQLLYKRGLGNRSGAQWADVNQLREIEPEAVTVTGTALYIPNSQVVDSKAILQKLSELLIEKGAKIFYESELIDINGSAKELICKNGLRLSFGHLVNAAGAFADRVAHRFGIGTDLAIQPFKGLYFRLAENKAKNIRGNIYPCPDLNLPFLGVHFTKSYDGKVYIGPNALPALGRENYEGFLGSDLQEGLAILWRNLVQYAKNKQNFRQLVHDEVKRLSKRYFLDAARKLVPRLEMADLEPCNKVGIRPQLYNTKTNELMMDFLVEHTDNSTHILNAISPGFTCSGPFAGYVVDAMKV
ncbi:MAG: L-2-hydroxyglutarate oxidase [Oligoflexales bacterium]